MRPGAHALRFRIAKMAVLKRWGGPAGPCRKLRQARHGTVSRTLRFFHAPLLKDLNSRDSTAPGAPCSPGCLSQRLYAGPAKLLPGPALRPWPPGHEVWGHIGRRFSSERAPPCSHRLSRRTGRLLSFEAINPWPVQRMEPHPGRLGLSSGVQDRSHRARF